MEDIVFKQVFKSWGFLAVKTCWLLELSSSVTILCSQYVGVVHIEGKRASCMVKKAEIRGIVDVL